MCNFGVVIKCSIKAIDVYLPEYELTNEELEKMVATTNEWILSRTGIANRRILKEEGKGASFMGAEAVKKLLNNNNIDPKSIDILICSTCTPDYKLPPTASIIAHESGLVNAWSFDINATCSGFIYGLELAKMMVESGRYNRVLLVNTEKMSSIIDYKDRSSCILFGDAATATLIEKTESQWGIEDIKLYGNGQEADKIIVKAGGSAHPINTETTKNKDKYFWQDGKIVFKRAVVNMENACIAILEKNSLIINDVNYFIAHQANKRILENFQERMGIKDSNMLINIEKYGNTSSVSIPLCIYENKNQFKKGDKIILTAFGSGYTWGAAWITWDC